MRSLPPNPNKHHTINQSNVVDGGNHYVSIICMLATASSRITISDKILTRKTQTQTIKDTIAYDINIKNGSQNFVVSLLVIKQIQRLRVELKLEISASNSCLKQLKQLKSYNFMINLR